MKPYPHMWPLPREIPKNLLYVHATKRTLRCEIQAEEESWHTD